MTARTLPSRGLVEQYPFVRDIFEAFVTEVTRDVYVRALQREVRLLFMIEKRRFPFH